MGAALGPGGGGGNIYWRCSFQVTDSALGDGDGGGGGGAFTGIALMQNPGLG